jgi:hypothetical protein
MRNRAKSLILLGFLPFFARMPDARYDSLTASRQPALPRHLASRYLALFSACSLLDFFKVTGYRAKQ